MCMVRASHRSSRLARQPSVHQQPRSTRPPIHLETPKIWFVTTHKNRSYQAYPTNCNATLSPKCQGSQSSHRGNATLPFSGYTFRHHQDHGEMVRRLFHTISSKTCPHFIPLPGRMCGHHRAAHITCNAPHSLTDSKSPLLPGWGRASLHASQSPCQLETQLTCLGADSASGWKSPTGFHPSFYSLLSTVLYICT